MKFIYRGLDIYIVKILFMGEILHQHLYKRSSSLLPPTHGVCRILAPYRSLEVLRVGEKHKTFALVSHYEHPINVYSLILVVDMIIQSMDVSIKFVIEILCV